MNSKLILSLLNHKKSEQGFTTVLAMGIGLIMMVIAATMMLRSQASRNNAFAQKETASSVGVAETGMTRNLVKLNTPTYYFYLTRSHDLGRNLGNDVKDEWGTPITNESQDLCQISPTPATIVNDLTNEVAINHTSKYQLLAYRYTPLNPTPMLGDSSVPIGNSNMLLQGAKNTNDTNEANDAKSRLEISFQVNAKILPASFPGLYASTSIDLNQADILSVTGSDDANIICSDCGATSTKCNDLSTKTEAQQKEYILTNMMGASTADQVDGKVYLSTMPMPSLPLPPTTICNLPTINDKSELKNCKIVIQKITTPTILPDPADISALNDSVESQLNNTDTSYYFNYEIDSADNDDINLSGDADQKLTIKTDRGPLRLYVKKNITMSGSANIEHIDTGKPERFALFGIGDSNQSFTINGGANPTGMFIYAPNASLTFNSAAGVNPDLIGAIWVKSFANNGDNFEMQVPDNFGSLLGNTYGNDYNLGFRSYSTSAPTGWQRKEIN